MTKPEEYSNNELARVQIEIKQILKEQNMKSDQRHEENQLAIAKIVTEVKVANGRTGNLERALSLLGDSFTKQNAEVETLKTKYWIATGIITVVMILGGLFAKLYVENLARNVASDVMDKYEKN